MIVYVSRTVQNKPSLPKPSLPVLLYWTVLANVFHLGLGHNSLSLQASAGACFLRAMKLCIHGLPLSSDTWVLAAPYHLCSIPPQELTQTPLGLKTCLICPINMYIWTWTIWLLATPHQGTASKFSYSCLCWFHPILSSFLPCKLGWTQPHLNRIMPTACHVLLCSESSFFRCCVNNKTLPWISSYRCCL